MAATYGIMAYTGAGPTETAFPANGRLHRGDSVPTTDGATSFVPIPASGRNYSWRRAIKLKITGGTYAAVQNLRFFSSGTSWGTGVQVFYRQTATYTQASASDEAGAISATQVTAITSASPLVVNAGTVSSTANAVTTGTQDYVELQASIDNTGSPGSTTPQPITYRTDEF